MLHISCKLRLFCYFPWNQWQWNYFTPHSHVGISLFVFHCFLLVRLKSFFNRHPTRQQIHSGLGMPKIQYITSHNSTTHWHISPKLGFPLVYSHSMHFPPFSLMYSHVSCEQSAVKQNKRSQNLQCCTNKEMKMKHRWGEKTSKYNLKILSTKNI